MKSAYEIAMARLEKEAGPSRKLTDAQKAQIADIEKRFGARVAEERLSFDARMAKAASFEEAQQLQRDAAAALASLEEQREKAKEAVWNQE